MERAKLPQIVQTALKELKDALQDLYGERLRGLYLCGSYARGTAHWDSDIDVLIVLAGSVQARRGNHSDESCCLGYMPTPRSAYFPIPDFSQRI